MISRAEAEVEFARALASHDCHGCRATVHAPHADHAILPAHCILATIRAERCIVQPALADRLAPLDDARSRIPQPHPPVRSHGEDQTPVRTEADIRLVRSTRVEDPTLSCARDPQADASVLPGADDSAPVAVDVNAQHGTGVSAKDLNRATAIRPQNADRAIVQSRCEPSAVATERHGVDAGAGHSQHFARRAQVIRS